MVFDLVFKGKKHVVREIKIKPKEIEFDKAEVDDNGNELKKIRNPAANGEKAFIFVDKDNKPVANHFKAIKGVAKKGFSKTKVINEDKMEVTSLSEQLSQMVNNDHTYYLINDELKAALKDVFQDKDKCLVCKPYTIRGFKAYKAIIYYNEKVDRVLMKLCRSSVLEAEMPEVTEVEEVTATDNTTAVSEDEIVC